MEVDIYSRKAYPAWVTGGKSRKKARRNPRSALKGGHHAKPAKGSRRPSFVPKPLWALAKTKTNKVNDEKRAQVEAARVKLAKLLKEHAAKPAAKKTAAKRKPAAKKTAAKRKPADTARLGKLEKRVSSHETRLGKVEGAVSTIKTSIGRRLAPLRKHLGLTSGRAKLFGPGTAAGKKAHERFLKTQGPKMGPGTKADKSEWRKIRAERREARKLEPRLPVFGPGNIAGVKKFEREQKKLGKARMAAKKRRKSAAKKKS
jgi:hypothetical protein